MAFAVQVNRYFIISFSQQSEFFMEFQTESSEVCVLALEVEVTMYNVEM